MKAWVRARKVGFMAAVVTLGACASGGGNTGSESVVSSSPGVPGTLALSILDEINIKRLSEGVPILVADSDLQALSRQMAQRHTMKHRNDLTTVQKANGFTYLNENLYRRSQAPSPKQVVEAWLNSSGHRRNLLTPRATLGAVAVSVGDDGYTYVVFNGASR